VTTSGTERADFAAIALLVAEEAGTLVAVGHRSRPRADEKGRHDLVTEFDRASEHLLVSRLGSLTPGIPVVGEESAERTQSRPGLVWYVDPLDGTTNFVHGHPFWCVSVGLMEDDEPIAGAVVAPILGLRWRGTVAPERRSGQSSSFRNEETCAVSATALLGNALLSTGFRPGRHGAPDNNFDSFMSVQQAGHGVRRCGAAAIDLCMVADGTYDGFWERKLHVWDVAAACAIVMGAGGKVTALDGGRPDYHEGTVVASNGLVHAELVEAITTGPRAP
jgi:myo-inositol-1(or 4)-monophosphatase